MRSSERLLIASNRLPFTILRRPDGVRLHPTCGGLAAALSGVHALGDHLWFGWAGPTAALADVERRQVQAALARRRVVPVELTPEEIASYYEEVCNGVLWPVLHSMIDRLPLGLPDLAAYRAVNERFAAAIAAQFREGDTVWIHDYHLLLAPALVRARLPHARIGVFLHTPFPSADVFRVLPWRGELLEGLLGASLIGFQTDRDRRNFEDCVESLTSFPVANGVVVGRRAVRLGVFPIGCDPLGAAARRPAAAPIRRRHTRLLVGVDRLDYTKGIPRRLMAFARLLERHPALRGATQLIQVAVPSRVDVPEYAALKATVEGLVERINARHATTVWTPVRYLPRALSPAALARLYRAADVMLVTSLRDGMNLVAKEFVMARTDDDGVLILSELAGASQELNEALPVNPYCVDGMAAAMAEALALPRAERQRRMRALRERVDGRNVSAWVDGYLAQLLDSPGRPARAARIQALAAAVPATVLVSRRHDAPAPARRARSA